jgi:hypothetical protein
MHRALPVVFALLALALYVLLGRGREESTPAPRDATSSEHAEESAGPDDGVALSPPALTLAVPSADSSSPALVAAPVDEVTAAPVADVPAEPRPGAVTARATAAPATPAAPAPARLAPELDGERGGALRDTRCRLSLNRMFLARGVAEREPVTVTTVFSSDDQPAYAFLDANNLEGPPQEVVLHWNHLGSDHTYEQRVRVGSSPRYRTWIYHTMRRPLAGNWHLRVTDAAGCALGELYFEATPWDAPG